MAEASLPAALLVVLGENVVLQPPLSRRGHGPGLILVRPSEYARCQQRNDSLDPEPLQKWAEEGYSVVQITLDPDFSNPGHLSQLVNRGIDALVSCSSNDSFGLLGKPVLISAGITLMPFSIWFACQLCATSNKHFPHCLYCDQESRRHGVFQLVGYPYDNPSARAPS